MDIAFELKRIVCRFPKLYSALQYFVEGRPYAVVSDQTLMCLEGYPRSGNTFALNLIRGVLLKHYPVFFATHAERLVSHHSHRIASVDAALRRGLPTFALIRAPGDAISSRVVRQVAIGGIDQVVAIRRGLTEYLDFYRYVRERTRVDIVAFDKLVTDSQPFIRRVLRALELDVSGQLELDGIEGFARELTEFWGREQMQETALTQNFSNERKENRKADVREAIEENRRKQFEVAQHLYEEIIKRTRE